MHSGLYRLVLWYVLCASFDLLSVCVDWVPAANEAQLKMAKQKSSDFQQSTNVKIVTKLAKDRLMSLLSTTADAHSSYCTASLHSSSRGLTNHCLTPLRSRALSPTSRGYHGRYTVCIACSNVAPL